MKRIKILICCGIVATALLASTVYSADDFGKGSVNWTEGYIEAIGYGTAKTSDNKGKDRINAQRAAEVSAQRALLEIIKGVHITSESTVHDSMLTDDHIRSRVDGIIKGAQTIDERVEWEGNSPVATVKMRICLSGGISECNKGSLVNVLNLEKHQDAPSIPKKMLVIHSPVKQEKLPGRPVVAPPSTEKTRSSFVCDLTKPVTGVVFTLEGRYFERSLLPVIITQADNEPVTVYSAKVVKPSVIRTFGAIRYAESVDTAIKSPQLGSNILVIPVADITKDNMVVIDSRDAATIKETLAHGNDYLGEAKVVISVK